MSNDINYDFRFRANDRETLEKVRRYLEEKQERWDNRGTKTCKQVLAETGSTYPAEVVTWGFIFGEIQEEDGRFCLPAESWANENSQNVAISGELGELRFLGEKFPEIEIGGTFRGEYGKGIVVGYYLEETEETAEEYEWGKNGDASYNTATTSLMLKLCNPESLLPDGLCTEDFRDALKSGADPNAWMDGAPLVEHVLQDCVFGCQGNEEREQLETLQLLLAHGMRADRPQDLAQVLLLIPGLPDTARAFAEKKKLIRSTDQETRMQIFRYLLKARAFKRGLPNNFLVIVGPPAKNEKELVKLAVKKDGLSLEYASSKLKDDLEIALLAVRSMGTALKFVSKRLRNDRRVVSAAVKSPLPQYGDFSYASARLKNDMEVALLAVRYRGGDALKFVSKRLRNDRRIVSAAVKSDGMALEYASKELRSDRKIMLLAVKRLGVALQFASVDLRRDTGVVEAAIRSQDCGGSEAFEFAAKKLQRDPDLKKMLKDIEG